MVLRKQLQKSGHKVETEPHGEAAVNRIKRDYEFDCILMDIQYVFFVRFCISRL